MFMVRLSEKIHVHVVNNQVSNAPSTPQPLHKTVAGKAMQLNKNGKQCS